MADETVAASGFANYPGDVTDAVGAMMGPNNLGELMMAVSAEHDEASNKTRVGFKVLPFPRQQDAALWPARKPNQQVHPSLLSTLITRRTS